MDKWPQVSDRETGTHLGRHHMTTQTLVTNNKWTSYQNREGTVKIHSSNKMSIVVFYFKGVVFEQEKRRTWVCSISHNKHTYRRQVGVSLVLVGHHGPVEVPALHQGHTCYERVQRTYYIRFIVIILVSTYFYSWLELISDFWDRNRISWTVSHLVSGQSHDSNIIHTPRHCEFSRQWPAL